MIRVGTRGSALALAQAGLVRAGLGADAEIVPMRTEGDRLVDATLAVGGGKGLFVREIEEALLRGQIDVAVHSLKDLPTEPPAGLALVAFLPREDARDVLVALRSVTLDDLPPGAVVGTSSPRRRALVLAARPDLAVGKRISFSAVQHSRTEHPRQFEQALPWEGSSWDEGSDRCSRSDSVPDSPGAPARLPRNRRSASPR